jgi:hypothetical protein
MFRAAGGGARGKEHGSARGKEQGGATALEEEQGDEEAGRGRQHCDLGAQRRRLGCTGEAARVAREEEGGNRGGTSRENAI